VPGGRATAPVACEPDGSGGGCDALCGMVGSSESEAADVPGPKIPSQEAA
jgi:hypothetical protein